MKSPTKPDYLYRVLRGGGWYGTSAPDVRAACRVDDTPMVRDNSLGFRTRLTVRQPRV